jgi:hypothetical protein
MRYIFMDEAGTSEREPVTVVVGLIVHADDHLLSAESLALEILGAVPAQFRDDFVFHAMQVYGDPKYQKGGWSLTDRLGLLQAMMSVPRRIGMAICLAANWRGAVDFSAQHKGMGLTPAQSDHHQAFVQCIFRADRAIRDNAGPREVASVVAEDVPEMRRHLKEIPKVLRKKALYLPQTHLRETVSDKEAGYKLQSGDYRVTRIRNSVHFVDKSDDPLVQIADACAYGFRRFFAGEKFGAEFARAILGDERILKNFASPGGAECYWQPIFDPSGPPR